MHYLFCKCNIIQNLWNDLVLFFEIDYSLSDLTPKTTKYLLLIFKIYICNSERSESLILKSSITEITKIKNIEEKLLIDYDKNTIWTGENGSKLKMLWQPKLFDTLPNLVFEWGGRIGQGSRQRELVLSNQTVTRKMSKVGFTVVNNFKKIKCYQKRKKKFTGLKASKIIRNQKLSKLILRNSNAISEISHDSSLVLTKNHYTKFKFPLKRLDYMDCMITF